MELNRTRTVVAVVSALLAIVFALRSPVAAEAADLHATASAAVHSQYLWRGRDYTFAAAPVAVLEAHGRVDSEGERPLSATATLRALNPLLRRGTPWEAATADTVQLGLRARGSLLRSNALSVELGTVASFHYGALIAGGVSHGIIAVEPNFAFGLPNVFGRPQWSGVVDLTPDQVGWRDGVEWFPRFDVGWGSIDGYAGVFRPHNYLKQKSRSFVGELIAGQPLVALVALIPSDLTLGARTLLPLAENLVLEPEVELLVVLNRPQNPSQLVPAAAISLHYGSAAGIPRMHRDR